MKLVSDQATGGEVLSGCLHDPDSLLIVLAAACGEGSAADALGLRDATGCPLFGIDELTVRTNQLIRAGLLQATSRRNAVLTPLASVWLRPAQQTN